MHADSAFVMGMGHRVCQDYARAGAYGFSPHLTYGIVSDGCSSSPDTDVGARLLALTAERLFQGYYEEGRFTINLPRVARVAESARDIFFPTLPCEALDATLLTVMADRPDRALVCCMGDGVIAAKNWDGALRIWDVEAPDGYPRYPNYLNHVARRELVEAGVPWIVRFPGGGEYHTSKVVPFEQPVEGAAVVAIFSDGVRSFTDAERRPIPAEEVVAELMAFKGYQGAFVQRRLYAFLKAAAKRGWRHEDDVAMAAIDMAAEGA